MIVMQISTRWNEMQELERLLRYVAEHDNIHGVSGKAINWAE